MKFSSVFSAISVFLHGFLFYTIFFVKICCCKLSCFLLIFFYHFRLVSPFLTFKSQILSIKKIFFQVEAVSTRSLSASMLKQTESNNE